MDELIQHFKNLEEDETLKRIDDAYNRGWYDAMNNPEVNKALEKNTYPDTFMKNLQAVWQKHTSENMRKNAAAVEKVALSIPKKTSADLAQKLN